MSDVSFSRDVNIAPGTQAVVYNQRPDTCMVEFFSKYVGSKTGKVAKDGSALGGVREFVKVIFPGDGKTEVVREATSFDRKRWPQQYARFKGGQAQVPDGYPLSHVAWLSRSWVDTFDHFHIKTLEQLAGLDDAGVQRVGMGARELVSKANAHLEQMRGTAPLAALSQENEQLKQRLEALEAKLAEIPRRPGRPKKEEAEEG